MTRLLVPGRTCSDVLSAPRSGVLLDGCDYYRELYRACCAAERSILIAGWQFDSDVPLLRDADAVAADHPIQLLPFLVSLCEARPELEVHVLAWDAAAIYVFEREPWQGLSFNNAHPRLRYQLDDVHPVGASHHQKLVAVDRSLAFLGSMDVCMSRWDDHNHRAGDARRVNRIGRIYGPYHEAQAYVTEPAVDVLRDWFGERWARASRKSFALPAAPTRDLPVTPTVAMHSEAIGLSRTQPPMREPPMEPIQETLALYLHAIASAERCIYIENQYYTSEDVHAALLERLARRPPEPPLELVLVLPEKPEALKERIALGVRQSRLLRELADAASTGGHHLGIYYSVDPGDPDTPVYMHSKVLSIDDRFVHVGSANTTNRSMGLDTELGMSWESEDVDASIRELRLVLLREHTGLQGEQADATLGSLAGLVARLNQWTEEPSGRLRKTSVAGSEGGVDLLEKLLPMDVTLDPKQPVLEDTLWRAVEGDDSSWLERVVAAWASLRAALMSEEESEEAAP